ncbi:uncharacterized protein BcabD6B2_28510 [Babesia caballi]|uniref:Uncharacterized protein n=1 Tax=Babesia caballi TaxID=5871 RepID=A0AAV4LWC6_BABCB|nr:hypothetical protein BcabD6B2_28510 [Babesia caballi]
MVSHDSPYFAHARSIWSAECVEDCCVSDDSPSSAFDGKLLLELKTSFVMPDDPEPFLLYAPPPSTASGGSITELRETAERSCLPVLLSLRLALLAKNESRCMSSVVRLEPSDPFPCSDSSARLDKPELERPLSVLLHMLPSPAISAPGCEYVLTSEFAMLFLDSKERLVKEGEFDLEEALESVSDV